MKQRLKMCTDDVQIAISSEFRTNFTTLHFKGGFNFVCVDKDVVPVFTLQEDFKGKGEYRFEGQAKLCTKICDDNLSYNRYKLSGSVKIEDNKDGEPIVYFINQISVSIL